VPADEHCEVRDRDVPRRQGRRRRLLEHRVVLERVAVELDDHEAGRVVERPQVRRRRRPTRGGRRLGGPQVDEGDHGAESRNRHDHEEDWQCRPNPSCLSPLRGTVAAGAAYVPRQAQVGADREGDRGRTSSSCRRRPPRSAPCGSSRRRGRRLAFPTCFMSAGSPRCHNASRGTTPWRYASGRIAESVPGVEGLRSR